MVDIFGKGETLILSEKPGMIEGRSEGYDDWVSGNNDGGTEMCKI